MANPQYLDLLIQGVDTWNKWRGNNTGKKIDLREANLTGANLSEANLGGVYLSRASLIGANLRKANLSAAMLDNTNLREANLDEANLSGAILWEASLYETYLRDANLVVTNLLGANLSKAHLSKAHLVDANLINANLSEADLYRADLHQATLIGAVLNKAMLNEANLSGADLSNSNLTEADLVGANLSNSNLTGADLTEADLSRATLVETNLTNAILTNCLIYGTSVWKVLLEGATQLNLRVTPPYEPTIKVDNLEVGQFIYLLLEHKKLRHVLNTVMERGVLLLGRFKNGGLELLQSIAAKLREMEYLPIIFDFPTDRPNPTETLITLVGLSRFVIVDLSGPSIPLELQATIPHFHIPFIPILEKGREIPAMLPSLLKEPWVLSPIQFTNQEHLIKLLPSRAIERAEKKFLKLKKHYQLSSL